MESPQSLATPTRRAADSCHTAEDCESELVLILTVRIRPQGFECPDVARRGSCSATCASFPREPRFDTSSPPAALEDVPVLRSSRLDWRSLRFSDSCWLASGSAHRRMLGRSVTRLPRSSLHAQVLDNPGLTQSSCTMERLATSSRAERS
jgi:hypothetical protein